MANPWAGILGLSVDKQAEAEKMDLKKGRQDFKEWDAGDQLRSFISGVSKEDLLKRTQDLQIEDIKDTFIGDTTAITDGLNGTGLTASLDIIPGETTTAYKARLVKERGRATAAQQLRAMKGGRGVELDNNATTGTINTLMSGLRDDNEVKAEAKIDRKEQGIKDERREERRFQGRREDARNDLTMQLGMMDADLADKRLAYDRETRSMDKRDRMIAQLMSSIGSLGGAFAL